jgi:hypothetical protein
VVSGRDKAISKQDLKQDANGCDLSFIEFLLIEKGTTFYLNMAPLKTKRASVS